MDSDSLIRKHTAHEKLVRCVHRPTGLILSVVKRMSHGDEIGSTVKIEYTTAEGQDVVMKSPGQFGVLTPNGEIVVSSIEDSDFEA